MEKSEFEARARRVLSTAITDIVELETETTPRFSDRMFYKTVIELLQAEVENFEVLLEQVIDDAALRDSCQHEWSTNSMYDMQAVCIKCGKHEE